MRTEMYRRRANSLGKSGSRAFRALGRTGSWNDRLDRAGTEVDKTAPSDWNEQQDQVEDQFDRHRRSSMKRMIRFCMSSSPSTWVPSSTMSSAVSISPVDLGRRSRSSGGGAPSVVEGDERYAPPAPPPVAALPSPSSPRRQQANAANHHQGESTSGVRPSAASSCWSVDQVEPASPTRSSPTPSTSLPPPPPPPPSPPPSSAPPSMPSLDAAVDVDVEPPPTPPSPPPPPYYQVGVMSDPLQSVSSAASTAPPAPAPSDTAAPAAAGHSAARPRRQRGRRERTHSENRRSRSRRQRNSTADVDIAIAFHESDDDSPIIRSPRRRRNVDASVDPEEESRRKQIGIWPHSMSSVFALLAATLGLFNISRFALLSIEHGGTFIVQFVLLTFLFGVPMLCFHGCLGQFLGSGIIDMWKISPIFKGVGVALLIAQAVEGVYSIVGIAWMFFYFRDSFIAQEDTYKWTRCPEQVRRCSPPTNYSFSLEETIPDYFQARVLQRSSVASTPLSFVSLKFEIAFNLAVIWMIIFVALGKGLRSYGKAVYAFGTLPLLGYLVVCIKILGVSSAFPYSGVVSVLDLTPWREFFTNSRVWLIAAREVFLTWGLCGAIVMQITAHNKYHHSLRRDIAAVIILTLLVLTLSAFVASACLQIINARGFEYDQSSSFETEKSYGFLKATTGANRFRHWSLMPRSRGLQNNLLMGIAVRPEEEAELRKPYERSGYQPMRLATELIPAVVAVIGPMEFSPFWAVLFYFSLVAFGIAHQLAIWHCVISGVVAFRACCLKSWETTITFCTCALGFLFSLPLATELGISIVYLMDYAMGSSWWLMIIYVIQIAAVLIVRGRPYSGESVLAVLVKGSAWMVNWASPLLSFSWSVVLPIGLLVLSVSSFKTGHFRDVFTWDETRGYSHWPVWVRQTGTMMQLVPLLLIPATGVIQSIRYLCRGPSDLFERVKLLYRPQFRTYIMRANQSESRRDRRSSSSATTGRSSRSRGASARPENAPSLASDPSTASSLSDPPPKYTPPPTYNTATGARLAKLLRESFRRSVRQLRHLTPALLQSALFQSPAGPSTALEMAPASTHATAADTAAAAAAAAAEADADADQQPPPTYTSVVMEMRRESANAEAAGDSTLTSMADTAACFLRQSLRRSARNTVLMLRRAKNSQAAHDDDLSSSASTTTTATALSDSSSSSSSSSGSSSSNSSSSSSSNSSSSSSSSSDGNSSDASDDNAMPRVHRNPSVVLNLPSASDHQSESVA